MCFVIPQFGFQMGTQTYITKEKTDINTYNYQQKTVEKKTKTNI